MPDATSVDSPNLVPEQGGAEEMPKADPFKILLEKADAEKVDRPKADAPKTEIPAANPPRTPGRLLIMSAGERSWSHNEDAGPAPESEPNSAMFGKRRLGALAAVVALAAVAGALGGAVATASLGHFGGNDIGGSDTASVTNHALEASVARLDADIQAMKAGAEHASRLGMTQFNKTSERLDKLEKAQLDAAKLAKLSEAVERLRAAPPVAAAAATQPPRRKPPARFRLRRPRHPRLKWRECRRWKAGGCATSPMAAP